MLFGALIALVAFTFRDYAISNDEEVQQRYGELIIAYYPADSPTRRCFISGTCISMAAYSTSSRSAEKLIPLDPYDVRHSAAALTGVGGIAAVWATARAIGGPRAGLLAAAAIALCGTWYGAMFNHTKDIPFAAAMMGALFLLLRIGRELPQPRWRLVVLFGVLLRLRTRHSRARRVSGRYAALAVALYAPIGRGRAVAQRVAFAARSALPFTAAFALAYAIMIAAWPWAALAPLNPLRALTDFTDFHYPIETLLDGHVYYMADVPRWYVPTYVAIKLTLVLLLGAALSLVLAILPQRGEPQAGRGNQRGERKRCLWRLRHSCR